jgi:hypothetical protein
MYESVEWVNKLDLMLKEIEKNKSSPKDTNETNNNS